MTRAGLRELALDVVGTAAVFFALAGIVSFVGCLAKKMKNDVDIAVTAGMRASNGCLWVADAASDPDIGDVCATVADVADGAAHVGPELAALEDADEKRKALARGVLEARRRRAGKVKSDAPTTVRDAGR